MTRELTLTAAGLARHALLAGPPDAGPLPAVLVLHGTGGTPVWARDETGWADLANAQRFRAVFPAGRLPDPAKPMKFLSNPPRWYDQGPKADADVAFISQLLDLLIAEKLADPARVYITGFSNGAAMTFRLAADLADRLAAVAPVSGYCRLDEPRPARPVPTFFLTGAADPLVPPAGGPVTTPWGVSESRPAVEATLARWAAALGLPPVPARRDDGGVTVLEYGPIFPAWFITGLGHHWPGGRGRLNPRLFGTPSNRVNATAEIWRFFASHAVSRSSHAGKLG